jgi:hypothetical protein
MMRRPTSGGRWPIAAAVSGRLGYDDPAAIRLRLRDAPPAPAQKTASLCAVHLAKKIAPVESS